MAVIPKRHEMILNAICNLRSRGCNFVESKALIVHFYNSPVFKDFWNIWVRIDNEIQSEDIIEDLEYLHVRGFVYLDNIGDRIYLTQKSMNYLCQAAQ